MAAKSAASNYDARIRRAERLASLHPFAQEVLSFYGKIANFQKSLQLRLLTGKNALAQELSFTTPQLKMEQLLLPFKEFLDLVATHGPVALAADARELGAASQELWSNTLRDYWGASRREDQPDAAFDQFLPRAFLQPLAESLGERIDPSPASGFPFFCPLCGARPVLGILRLEGDGGKRFLLCSFCLHEWEFRRIFCATCGEETESKLPVYVAEQLPYIRVEACDTCKFYLRSIDLTKDGNAVPLVDDLAALPLSLWAEEHGYARAQPNLLGT
jgi:FdhE protein